MKKLLSSRNETIKDAKATPNGIRFSLELINGDLKQVCAVELYMYIYIYIHTYIHTYIHNYI